MHKDIIKFNRSLSTTDKAICNVLAQEIDTYLPDAESKIWHKFPVWFIDGNPIVGYDKLKDSVRLLFWSGQSFKAKGLQAEGKFKAAAKRYTSVEEVAPKDIKRWIKDAKSIQWDYKNIVKRKGKLIKIIQK